MKKLILTTIALSLLQTPAFAEVTLSNFEIYMQGKIRGILYCQAFKGGARTVQDIVRFKEQLNDPDINFADRVYYLASPAQKEYFSNGWQVYTMQNCPNEMKRMINDRSKTR